MHSEEERRGRSVAGTIEQLQRYQGASRCSASSARPSITPATHAHAGGRRGASEEPSRLRVDVTQLSCEQPEHKDDSSVNTLLHTSFLIIHTISFSCVCDVCLGPRSRFVLWRLAPGRLDPVCKKAFVISSRALRSATHGPEHTHDARQRTHDHLGSRCASRCHGKCHYSTTFRLMWIAPFSVTSQSVRWCNSLSRAVNGPGEFCQW